MRPSTPPEEDDPEDDSLDPNHSLETGRKSESAFYGDDPDADPDDANLSALFAQLGTQDRLDEVGL